MTDETDKLDGSEDESSSNDSTDKQPKYKTGFKKPPKHTQFKPGQSGNPNGRPKRSKNMNTLLSNELDEKIVINEKGKRITITKRETIIKRLVNEAANGNQQAMRTLLSMNGNDNDTQETPIARQSDEEIFSNLVKRYNSSSDEEE